MHRIDNTTSTPHRLTFLDSSNGVVHVSYSYVHRPQRSLQEPPEVFHTRQLSYPVLVTVYHMLECHDMDILPYSPDTITELLEEYGDDDSPEVKARRELLNVDDDAEWCLFSVEVRNTYGLPFEVTFERDQPGNCNIVIPQTCSDILARCSTCLYLSLGCSRINFTVRRIYSSVTRTISLMSFQKYYPSNQEVLVVRRPCFSRDSHTLRPTVRGRKVELIINTRESTARTLLVSRRTVQVRAWSMERGKLPFSQIR